MGLIIENELLMKLRTLFSTLFVVEKTPWYGLYPILSCALLLPLQTWAVDSANTVVPPDPSASTAIPACNLSAVVVDDVVEGKEVEKLKDLQSEVKCLQDAMDQRNKKIEKINAKLAGKTQPSTVVVKAFHFVGNKEISTEELNKVAWGELNEKHKGKSVNSTDLTGILAKVAEYYRTKKYFLAVVVFPKPVVDGLVTMQVAEGKIGKIDITTPLPTNVNLTKAQFEGYINAGIKEGEIIRSDRLERALWLLGDLPGVRVTSLIQPGTEFGTADIKLAVVEVPKVPRTSVEFDNAGNRFAGEYRGTVRTSINGPFGNGNGDALNLNFTVAEAPLNVFGGISYLAPIAYNGTRVGFNVSRLNYLLGKDFKDLNVQGTATIAELLATYPFQRTKDNNLFGQVSVEHKRLNDQQAQVPSQLRDINLLKLKLSGDWREDKIANIFNLDFVLGNLNIKQLQDRDEDSGANGFHTAGTFGKLNFSINRFQKRTVDFETWFALSGQVASKNLTSAEKFVLGGPGKVRGYPAGEASGDQGFVATAEVRYSKWKDCTDGGKELNEDNIKKCQEENEKNGKLAFSIFVDYGYIRRNANPGRAALGDQALKNGRSLYGAGVGVNWGRENKFLLRADLAWGLSGKATSDTKSHNPHLWLQGVWWY